MISEVITASSSCKLGEVVGYVSEKISIEQIHHDNYVSTENMIENFGGVMKASSIPNQKTTSKFIKNDVLFSNIRTYFKKVWLAQIDGGCSNDVLVIRPRNDRIDSKFLYFTLTHNDFISHSVQTSKGTKMPRGDKQALLNYEINLPSLEKQKRIADILSSLDDKIALNREMNKTLEAMAQAIFKSWFVDFEPFKEGEFVESELGMIPKGWEVGQLGDNIKIIDNRGKTPPICIEITEYPIIEVNALSGENRTVNYSAIKKYVSEETYNSWFRAGHPKKNDILLSTVGSVGEVAMFPDNRGSIAQNVVALRAINTSPYYLYQTLVNMKDKLKGLDIGSVQPSIKVTQMTKIHFLWPKQYVLQQFDGHVENLVQKIHLNETEIEALSQVRDTLLPKLLSGEMEV